MQMRFYTQRMKIVNKANGFCSPRMTAGKWKWKQKKLFITGHVPRQVFKQFKFMT
jgi:hypothetical protein